MSDATREWRLKALSDIWTGDAERNGQRTIPTGLLGSLRWWFEVLIRGLRGATCDPTDEIARQRCPGEGGQRCLVCELFACTGWARKFRFEVRDANGEIAKDQLERNAEFILRFTPLRPIAVEEWALLDLTLRLIAGYGALGGRTVLKPSDEADRARLPHHHDYGIVEVEASPSLRSPSRAGLESYVHNNRWRAPRQETFAWASLTNFWCVNGKYLARQSADRSSFNRVLGRNEPRNRGQQLAGESTANRWLAGKQQESKKVFSFKDPPRTFGFVRPGTISLDGMRQRLEQAWGSIDTDAVVAGDAILARLLRSSDRES